MDGEQVIEKIAREIYNGTDVSSLGKSWGEQKPSYRSRFTHIAEVIFDNLEQLGYRLVLREARMEARKPTPAEIREFWEWCGLEHKRQDGIDYWYSADAKPLLNGYDKSPELDLNNLFKYAVPKLHGLGYDYKLWSDDSYHFAQIMPIDDHDEIVGASVIGELRPEDALYQAIKSFREVIHSEE